MNNAKLLHKKMKHSVERTFYGWGHLTYFWGKHL